MTFYRAEARIDLASTEQGGLTSSLRGPVRELRVVPGSPTRSGAESGPGFTAIIDVDGDELRPGQRGVGAIIDFMAVGEARDSLPEGATFQLSMVDRIVGSGTIGRERSESRLQWLADETSI